MEDRGHPGRAVRIRSSVHVSRRRIRAGQCAGLGADRRSHVSCPWWTARQFLGVFTGPKALRRAAATLPVADADIALTGRRVRWFQEWIRHGPDDPYWLASDHRGNVGRMSPVVYLQGGWYDFFLPGMLADYAALRAAGRAVRLLIGPWTHGRGLYTRVGMRDAVAALNAALADGTLLSGVRVFITGSRRWTDLPGWPPPTRATAQYLHSDRPARRPPSLRRPPKLVSL